ncbi:MAG: YbaK/EbsC family protein [Micropruina sp.]|uniref:aminoacyl-tRNA deacylase n=1 Tax=Micropruina sp. TaxID=2737536 RepID=UPI0039E66D90
MPQDASAPAGHAASAGPPGPDGDDRAEDRTGKSDPPAASAARALGLTVSVIRHGPVSSLAEAAAARGVRPRDIVKTMVVRRGPGDYLFVLVPGDAAIAWPKLRALLGVSRLSMLDAEVAREVTGYQRGTITPFGARIAWPVIADASITGRRVSLGSGVHGAALGVDADAMLAVLNATIADIV